MGGFRIPICEVCGRKTSRLFRVLIEGAELSVCMECSKLGTLMKPRLRKTSVKTGYVRPVPVLRRLRASRPKKAVRDIEETVEAYTLVENYGLVVKKARERMGMTIKDLGAKVGEKASVISKVEQGRLKPDNALARKLEHVLRVRLLIPSSEVEDKEPKTSVEPRGGITIGDILRMKLTKPRE